VENPATVPVNTVGRDVTLEDDNVSDAVPTAIAGPCGLTAPRHAPWAGVIVYSHRPFGTALSVQVRAATVPAHVPATLCGVVPPATYRATV
jgi:hypothetical protein